MGHSFMTQNLTPGMVPQAGCDTQLAWLLEGWKKQWPTLNEVELPEMPWQTVKEGIRRDRDTGSPAWLYGMLQWNRLGILAVPARNAIHGGNKTCTVEETHQHL